MGLPCGTTRGDHPWCGWGASASADLQVLFGSNPSNTVLTPGSALRVCLSGLPAGHGPTQLHCSPRAVAHLLCQSW